MGEGAPYMYSNRPLESDFNPRLYSEKASSYASSVSHARPKQHGPLLDFNRHPDSWMVVTPSYLPSDKTLPGNFKRKVVATRWVQFVLRIVQLFASLGLFICVVCIKGTVGTQSWLLRIPPPWDAIISTYSIYHLLRPAGGRTPASSSSYQWFSLCMDLGLIPFYVYAIIFTQINYMASPDADGRWTTLFKSDGSDDIVLLTAFVTASTLGFTHFLSMFLDVFLGLWFRKVAMLPPDMNPLVSERKAKTAKPINKHKHKTSDVSTKASRISEDEKSASLYGASHKSMTSQSQMSMPRSPVKDNGHMVSFAQSRMGGSTIFSPHTPESIRAQSNLHNLQSQSSRQTMPSDRASRTDTYPSAGARQRSRSRYRTNEQRDSPQLPPLPSQSSFHTRSLTATPETASRNEAMTPEKRHLLKDSWYAMDEQDFATAATTAIAAAAEGRKAPESQYGPVYQDPPHAQHYNDLHEPFELSSHANDRFNHFLHDDRENYENVGRALTMGSSLYSESIASPLDDSDSGPKNRYYGDLSSSNIHLVDMPLQQGDVNRNASGTGVELVDRAEFGGFGHGHGNKRQGRFVSGKVAEEGRVGGGWEMRRRDLSGTS